MGDRQLSNSYLEISKDALRSNARAVCAYVGVPVMGVVKCDGYGVSLAQAAGAWVEAGVETLAVSDPAEALELRREGFEEQDILLLTPVATPELVEALLEAGVILTVSGPAGARFYAQRRGERRARVHVAVDTGMGRFGSRWSDTEELLEVYRTPGLEFEGIFSHFADSFEKGEAHTKLQLKRFLSAVAALEERGVAVGTRHMANSCAALRFPDTWLDAVRPGSALVGRLQAPSPIALERVGEFKATVVERRVLKKGETTGYASVCRLRRDTDVAVVAIGRNDGFGLVKRPERIRALDLLRSLRQAVAWWRGPLCVRYGGRALPVVGRVGTQYTLVDAAGTDLEPGDMVSAQVDLLFPHPHRVFV